MALILAHQDPTGIRHPEAYWRIDEIDLDYRARRAQIRVACFHDREAAGGGFAPVDQRWYYPDGDDFDSYFRQSRASLQVYDDKGLSITFANPLDAGYHFVKRQLVEKLEVPAEVDDKGKALAVRFVDEEVPGFFGEARNA